MAKERFIFNQVNKRKLKRNYHTLILQAITFLFLMNYISIQSTSEIHLIIDGGDGGWKDILNSEFSPQPSEVWVDGVNKTNCGRTCDLAVGLNSVTLKFDSEINSCSYMFGSLTNLKEIDLSDFDASQVVNMEHMFHGCSNLQKVTFGDINTRSVTNMGQLFEGCSNLVTIDLYNLKTGEVTSLESAFNGCSSLVSIDLSNLDTSKVTKMLWMFYKCASLQSVNFGNIDTSKVETTWNMFSECYNLKSIDLSNLHFSNLNTMETMFSLCYNLESVNIGNSITSSVQSTKQMFLECHNLKSIDLSNSILSGINTMEGMFSGCYKIESINFGNTNVASPTNLRETFRECDKLVSLDLSHWDFSNVNNMVLMFYNCDILEHVKFGKINSPSVIDLEKIFQKCRKIREVDFSPLGNSKVQKLDWMFEGCYSLETVNFGELDTTLVDNLNGFFCECYSLLIMDLNNFNTSSVTAMEHMFKDCINLRSLDLSTFDTTKVTNMYRMFYNCSSLIYLNLANFLNVNMTNIDELFGVLSENVKFCINDINTRDYLFGSNSSKNSICNDKCFTITNPRINMDTNECLSSCSESSSNKFEYRDGCYVKCPDGTVLDGFNCSYNECEGKPDSSTCKDGTPLGYYYDSTDKIYKNCYEKCNYCNGEGTETNNNCKECISGYRLLEDNNNIINCYENCQYYYYFDNSNGFHCTGSNACPVKYSKLIEDKGQCIYEEVIQTTLLKEVTTIITEALTVKPTPAIPTTEYNPITSALISTVMNNPPMISTAISNPPMISTAISNPPMISTAISNPPMISTAIINPPMISTAISSTSPQKPDTIRESENIIASSKAISTSNIETDTNIIENTFNLEQYGCVGDNPLTLTCSMEETRDNNEIYDILVNDILSTYDEDNGKNIILEGHNNTIFQITNTKNELELLKNGNLSDNYSLSIIDLAECEKKLKEEYNIAEEDSLIFIKQEKVTDKESEKSIQYECYEPYNKTKLNLSLCSGININLYVPLSLSEETKTMAEQMKELGYNMFDINDKFYQDTCSPYKSSVNSDIILSDRVDTIYNNEDTRCQGNCEFSNYALGSRYISCSCPAEVETSSETQVKKIDKFEPKSIYEMFYNVLKYSNYEVFKCYKLVFVKNVLTKNLGSIIILILFILYLMCLIAYIFTGLKPLKNKISDFFIEKDKKINLYFPPIKKRNSVAIKPKSDSKKRLSKYPKEKENKKENNKESKKENKKENKNKKQIRKSKYQFVIFNKNVQKKRSNSGSNLIKDRSKSFSSKSTLKTLKNEEKLKSKIKRKSLIKVDEKEKPKKQLDDFELNDLSYTEAIEQDKRNFFQIYFSYIKREHRVVFSFFYCYDYNLIPVKLSRFFFLLATDMALNVFFFSDASMHKIYIDYGKYDILQQIPQIIYSTIASQLIEVFLCFLSLTDKHIYQIKNLEGKSKNIKVINEIFKCIKIKIIFYFVSTFILFGIYWYMVATFCAVYENTQKAFIKDSLMSFLMSLAYPFILYAIPTSLRLIAIRCTKIKLEWVYKLSDVIPFF